MSVRRAAAVLLLLAAPAAAQTTAPSTPPAAVQRLDAGLPRRCGVCHLDKAPPAAAGPIAFVPPRGAGEAGAAGMCFSCHNGIVDDRRRYLANGRHHPAAGRVSCGSCHTPHVREANVGAFMRFPAGSFSWCASCHPGRGGGAAGEHPAVAQEKGRRQDCGGCHDVHGAPGEGLVRAGSAEALCIPCHGENPSRQGRGPGMATHVTGKGGPLCLGCHSVHRTVGGKALLGKAAFEGRLCRQCHERTYSSAKGEANHPVAAAGASCLSCHRMHNAEKQGARRGLLAVAWEGAEEICRRCHAALAKGDAGDGPWNHPVGGSVAADERSLGSRLVRSGAYFAPGGKVTCLSCHRAHGGRGGTPQLVTAREALCLYCHPAQNSLDPERAALGAHPVSVRPRKAKIAAAFVNAGGVNGPDGEITCTTCHRAHRGWGRTPGLVLPRESYSCLLCHSGEASVAATAHGTARTPGAPAPASGGLCGGCHGEHGWRLPPGEAREGETTIDRICLSCHGGSAGGTAPLATNHPVGLGLEPGRGSGGLPLFWNDGRRYRRGVITCATCHDPHRAGSDGHFLRDALGGRSGEQCLGCHRSQATVAGTRHDASGAGGSICGPCHPVHDPLGVAAWPAIRGGERATVDLAAFCGGCHGAQGEAAPAPAVAERTHPARPRAGQKAIGCGGCHDPHRWNPLDAADRGGRGGGDEGTSFLVRPASGPAPLCTACHAEEGAVVGTPHDLGGRGADGKNQADGHEPQRRGVCAACHRVHAEQAAGVAAPSVAPAQSGGKPTPAADPCEACHADGGIAAGSSVGRGGHPVGVAAGQDFGPDLPLFGSDGRRQPRGRIACATCHDPHRWEPSGGSGSGSRAATSFLRMGADGYAPLCFPCHADKSMVVGTDHDLRVTAPRAANGAGETAEASGVCGACHAVHGETGRLALWNRGYGTGWDERSRICTGCHQPDNDLAARVPPRPETHFVNYPGRGLVSRLFTPPRMVATDTEGIPVFAADGSRAEQGYLSCASCHDVHRWESKVSSSGSGSPSEGDLANSFLRVPPSALEWTLCAECHAASLLEHYRNYHFPEGK